MTMINVMSDPSLGLGGAGARENEQGGGEGQANRGG